MSSMIGVYEFYTKAGINDYKKYGFHLEDKCEVDIPKLKKRTNKKLLSVHAKEKIKGKKISKV